MAPWRGENLLRSVALEMRDGEQQVLGGNVFVFEVGGFFEGLFEQLVDFVRQRSLRRAAGNLRQLFDSFIDLGQHSLRADADFFQHGRDDAFFVFEQRSQKMERLQFWIAVLGGEFVRALDGFLRFDSEFVPTDCHGFTPLCNFPNQSLNHWMTALDSPIAENKIEEEAVIIPASREKNRAALNARVRDPVPRMSLTLTRLCSGFCLRPACLLSSCLRSASRCRR